MEVTQANDTDSKELKCIWKGCDNKSFPEDQFPPHFSQDDKIEGANPDGREKAPTDADEPWDLEKMGAKAYLDFGIKHGENKGLTSGRYAVKTSSRNRYTTQYHHVISLNIIKGRKGQPPKFEDLAYCLGLIGWNINDKDYNGINLPYFREDQIWHNLQPHRGAHPEKEYYAVIENKLGRLQEKITTYCDNKSKSNEELLLEKINKISQDFRNFILQWKINVHLDSTQKKWMKWLKMDLKEKDRPSYIGYYEPEVGDNINIFAELKKQDVSMRKYPTPNT